MHKQQTRQRLKTQRDQLTPAQHTNGSQQCVQVVVQHPLWQHAKHIGLYQAIGSELCLHALATCEASHDKHFYLPVIDSHRRGHMVFCPWHPNMLCHRNAFGILEPSQQDTIAPAAQLDLIIAPCLGLTAQGHRLGTGGGYYDRYLAQPNRPKVLGIAYDIQQCEALPMDPWDQHCDAVIFVRTGPNSPRW